jgi:cytochrome b
MSSQDADSSMVKVWDPLVRVFHWSLVFLFLLAFITEDDWLDLHVLAGYAVSFLIGFRLLWGLVGTRNARSKFHITWGITRLGLQWWLFFF